MPRPTPKGRKPYSSTSKPAKKGPKSFKSDGTPKARWSSEKRSTEGHTPRRGGSDRPWGREERPARSFDRDDRGPRKFDRDDRGGRSFDRDDRGPRKFDRDDRPARSFDRDDRGPRKFDRDDRGGRSFDRDDRGPRKFDRDDRGGRSFERDDRGPRGFDGPRRSDSQGRNFAPWNGGNAGRDERRGYGRDDRAPRSFDRDDRGPRNFDRGPRNFDRDDRPARSFDRDDRGPRRERPDYRPARPFIAGAPKAEPRYERKPWEKGERPHRDERREERRPWNRDEAPRERRDDRGEFENIDADVMSWSATDLGEIDDSQVDASQGFAALGVPPILVAALDKQGITSPFPIQAATIPDAIAGRDVLGRGQTGSGKTLGFGLPMLTRIQQNKGAGKAPLALVLVPTRELALQCADVISPLAKALKLETTLIAGGMSYQPQLRAFDRGVDIVVATPGRLIDLLEQGAVDLSQVQVTVLDEADHMADLGFMPAVTTLLDAVPADGQRLLFSATLDGAVDKLVKRYLTDPVTHEVDGDKASVTTMEHVFLNVLPHDKNATTAAIANRDGRTVLFARTQMGASRIAEQLRAAGVMAGALHGGLTQGARTRILAAFKEGTVPVLVATDVAARGIHVDDVTLVLEVDPPMNSKDYLHRAGRTARAGTKGVVASIVLPHQRRTMQRIADGAGVQPEMLQARPGDEALAEVTGARAPESMPIEDSEYEKLISPRKQSGPRGGGRGKGGFNRGGGGYRGRGGDRRGGREQGWRRDS